MQNSIKQARQRVSSSDHSTQFDQEGQKVRPFLGNIDTQPSNMVVEVNSWHMHHLESVMVISVLESIHLRKHPIVVPRRNQIDVVVLREGIIISLWVLHLEISESFQRGLRVQLL